MAIAAAAAKAEVPPVANAVAVPAAVAATACLPNAAVKILIAPVRAITPA